MDRDRPDRTDWAALRAMSAEKIERIAAEDGDNPATDDSHWADATVGLPPAATTGDQAAKLRALDDALTRGIADVEAGRVKPIDEAFAHIRSRLLATAEDKLRRDIQDGLGSDRAKLAALTDAEIERMATTDPDHPALDDDFWAGTVAPTSNK